MDEIVYSNIQSKTCPPPNVLCEGSYGNFSWGMCCPENYTCEYIDGSPDRNCLSSMMNPGCCPPT